MKANEKGTCGKGRWEEVSHLRKLDNFSGEREIGGKKRKIERKEKIEEENEE